MAEPAELLPLPELPGVTHRTLRVAGRAMHVAEAGEGPLVLLLHGFPELWYSWRHQLTGLAGAGFRAVAPDLRGYGRTDSPPGPTSTRSTTWSATSSP